MVQILFHVFRNTPFGRETFLQSVFFSKVLKLSMRVYIPKFKSFLMYFENDVVQVDLDKTYLLSPETAEQRVRELVERENIEAQIYEPKHFTASCLPDIPTDCHYMTCPRSMSDPSPKIGFGHIGPRVRKLIQAADFPVLIPSMCFKEWESLTVMFGGSANATKALRLGLYIHSQTGVPVDMFTFLEKGEKQHTFEKIITAKGLMDKVNETVRDWRFEGEKSFEDILYDISPTALIIMGAYGHGVVKEILFGSKFEMLKSKIANNMLIVGPKFTFRV